MSIKPNIKCILLFSGKRKSGKDFLTGELEKSLKELTDVVVVKISAPIKNHFATTFNLKLSDLMSDGPYKEIYRRDMIKWSTDERNKDPGVFCREAVKMYEAETKPVWIVSDVRRKTDISWFLASYGDVIKTVRVQADDETRIQRGFVFTEDIDASESECNLDDYINWNWEIDNNIGGNPEIALQAITNYVKNVVK